MLRAPKGLDLTADVHEHRRAPVSTVERIVPADPRPLPRDDRLRLSSREGARQQLPSAPEQ